VIWWRVDGTWVRAPECVWLRERPFAPLAARRQLQTSPWRQSHGLSGGVGPSPFTPSIHCLQVARRCSRAVVGEARYRGFVASACPPPPPVYASTQPSVGWGLGWCGVVCVHAVVVARQSIWRLHSVAGSNSCAGRCPRPCAPRPRCPSDDPLVFIRSKLKKYAEGMVKVLKEEADASTDDSPDACMEFVLQENLFHVLLLLGKNDVCSRGGRERVTCGGHGAYVLHVAVVAPGA
jgi:hypothetical protein